MKFGVAPDQSKPDFVAMKRQARLVESLGYSALWAHEHHSNAMMYPDPLMALAAMAEVTERVELGTSMLLLPIHHPVRVAQEAAMLDVMSDGRVRLGVAGGYSATDLSTFGVSSRHRGKRLDEGIPLIRRLWSGEPVTAAGSTFELDNFVLFPPPVQSGGPPIFVGGHADRAIRRAAELGDNYFISTTAGIPMVGELVETYRKFLRETGKPFERVLLNRVVCCVETSNQKAEARQFFARALLNLYASWGHDNVTRLSDAERSVDHIADANLIVGEPDECYERLLEYEELGVGHVACLMSFGAPPTEVLERSITLFGERVLPRFS